MSYDNPPPEIVIKAADNQQAYFEKRKQHYEELDGLIQTAENYLLDAEGEPILLFPENQRPDRQNPVEQSKYAANLAFDGLMDTLLGITEHSAEYAKKLEGVGDNGSQDFETVARAMVPLVQVWSNFARGELPVTPDDEAEQRYERHGDKVYIYNTREHPVDTTDYQNISVFIRPQKYENPTKPKEPRLTIKVSPASSHESAVTMRIDYDNLEEIHQKNHPGKINEDEEKKQHELTFDLEVGGDADILHTHQLHFPDESKNHVIRQRQGHHFSTNISEYDLGVNFSDLLEAMVDKAEENVTANKKTKLSELKK